MKMCSRWGHPPHTALPLPQGPALLPAVEQTPDRMRKKEQEKEKVQLFSRLKQNQIVCVQDCCAYLQNAKWLITLQSCSYTSAAWSCKLLSGGDLFCYFHSNSSRQRSGVQQHRFFQRSVMCQKRLREGNTFCTIISRLSDEAPPALLIRI